MSKMLYLQSSGLNDSEIAANHYISVSFSLSVAVTTPHGHIKVTLYRILCCTTLKMEDLHKSYNSGRPDLTFPIGIIQVSGIFKCFSRTQPPL